MLPGRKKWLKNQRLSRRMKHKYQRGGLTPQQSPPPHHHHRLHGTPTLGLHGSHTLNLIPSRRTSSCRPYDPDRKDRSDFGCVLGGFPSCRHPLRRVYLDLAKVKRNHFRPRLGRGYPEAVISGRAAASSGPGPASTSSADLDPGPLDYAGRVRHDYHLASI